LGFLTRLRKTFDKSEEIDALDRAELVERIQRKGIVSETLANNVLTQFDELAIDVKGWERPSRSYGVADSKVFVETLRGHAWGKTVVKFRAKVEDVAAFFWDYKSRANMEISGDVERSAEEKDNCEDGAFRMFVKRRQHLENSHGAAHRDRIFASDMTLNRIDDDTFIVLLSDSPLAGPANGEGGRRSVLRGRGSVDKSTALSSKEKGRADRQEFDPCLDGRAARRSRRRLVEAAEPSCEGTHGEVLLVPRHGSRDWEGDRQDGSVGLDLKGGGGSAVERFGSGL
jgi:hypothetical protein